MPLNILEGSVRKVSLSNGNGPMDLYRVTKTFHSYSNIFLLRFIALNHCFCMLFWRLTFHTNSYPEFCYLARMALRCQRLIFYHCRYSFFLLFFRCLISEVTERISTKLAHIIHLWLLFEKFGPNCPRLLPPTGRGAKKTLFGTDFELWPNISLQRNIISTIRKKIVNLQKLTYMSPNLVNFGPETAENGWRVFANLLNFRIGRHCQPYRRWCGGTTDRALDLQSTGRGPWVHILLGAKLHNNLRQVVHTYVPLSPSSITWYQPRGGDALQLGR